MEWPRPVASTTTRLNRVTDSWGNTEASGRHRRRRPSRRSDRLVWLCRIYNSTLHFLSLPCAACLISLPPCAVGQWQTVMAKQKWLLSLYYSQTAAAALVVTRSRQQQQQHGKQWRNSHIRLHKVHAIWINRAVSITVTAAHITNTHSDSSGPGLGQLSNWLEMVTREDWCWSW